MQDEGNKPQDAGAAEESFAALFAASEQGSRRSISAGDVVRGTVVHLGQDAAFVDLGGKGEGTIELTELRDAQTGEVHVAVGDEIEATVVDAGHRSGVVILKRTFGRGGAGLSELENALAHGIPVEGFVAAENKGGFEVRIGSIRAFCPGSQIDLRRGAERVPGAAYVGQRFLFRVVKVENGGRNVVVSRRDLLAQERAEEAQRTWEKLRVGAVVSGTVSSLRDFGAFVDLGGVDGLIPIGELAYDRVKHPSDKLSVGDRVDVQVIRVEEQAVEGKLPRRQVALSLKALAADPWQSAAERFPVGSSVTGTVRRLEQFGAFVELEPGLEGLVHISKMSLDRRLSHARQAVSEGDRVQVTVLGVDPAQRRVSLSMVEKARRERDAEVAADRAEQGVLLEKANRPSSFGTFGDLLAASRGERKRRE